MPLTDPLTPTAAPPEMTSPPRRQTEVATSQPLGPGAIMLVVGPSGAGKDTVLRLAQGQCAGDPDIVFPRRIITRGPDAHEDHQPIDPREFDALLADGVALSWRAHGLGYAVPRSIDADIAAGRVVVVNVSRRIIAGALSKYARVAVVCITAPADVLAERLQRRGREAAADVAGRLGRAGDSLPEVANLTVIENVGDPAASAGRLADLIRQLQSDRPR